MININEIHNIFMQDCENRGEKFTDKVFQDFSQFIEIDFYDWVRENLRSFYQQRQD